MADWSDIDNRLLDPHWYATGEYYEAFRKLRDEDPIHWTEDERFGKSYWTVTRYEDCKEYLLNDRQLSNRWHTHIPRTPKRMTPEDRYAAGLDVALPMTDNPIHDLYRRPLNKYFSVPAVAKMQGDIDLSVDELLAEMAEQEVCDVTEHLGVGLPTRVVLRWVGVPEQDWDDLRVAMWRMSAPTDPRHQIDGDPLKTAKVGHERFWEYSEDLARQRIADPQDDFTSVVVNMEIDGEKMSMHEIVANLFFLISGALENTRNTISIAIWLFLQNPDQRRKLLADPSLAKPAVEEVLRWASPSRNRLRIANEDFDFGGRHIRAGDWVCAFLASANRDEREFENPDAFEIERQPNRHLGLGAGTHTCLGRNLVRLEMGVLLQRLFETFDLDFAEEPVWVADALGNGLSKMPLRLTQKRPVAATAEAS